MIKIPYQKKYDKVILPLNEFNTILSNRYSSDIEFEEVEFLTKDEEIEYVIAMEELKNSDTVKYDELLKLRAAKNV